MPDRVDSFTVFFGRNNAGKTNALEAIARLLTGSEDHARRRPEVSRSFGRQGRVWFDVPDDGASLDRSWRAMLYDAILARGLDGPALPVGGPNLESSSDVPDPADVSAHRRDVALNMLSDSAGEGSSDIEERRVSAYTDILCRSLMGIEAHQLTLGLPDTQVTPHFLDLVNTVIGVGGSSKDSLAAFELSRWRDQAADDLENSSDSHGPWPAPLDLWRGQAPLPLRVMWLDWEIESLASEVVSFLSDRCETQPADSDPWLTLEDGVYRLNDRIVEAAARIETLSNTMLPDFVAGKIRLSLTSANSWHRLSRVLIEFEEHGAIQCADVAVLAGSGYARWISAALRLAMLVWDQPLDATGNYQGESLDGVVLFVDEPEAHLHPDAVASVVRWCRKMVDRKASVFVATHHDQFLRRMGHGAALVHVTKPAEPSYSRLRRLEPRWVPDLLDLGADIGLAPATMLGLHNGILFVEGPLDVAVLEELAGDRLAGAGIVLVPIQGTRNIEGIVSAETLLRLGVPLAILTDDTDPDTMRERSNKRRSSEEKKILKVLALAEEAGIAPPKVFGVPQRDLLHALPEIGIKAFGARDFPGWAALDGLARVHEGAGGSESVNWKKFARDQYGLPIDDEDGVRSLVRWLDVNGYTVPEVNRLVDEVVDWATARSSG